MLTTRPYSNYVLLAVESIKLHIDKDPFQYQKSSDLLDHLCTPHRNVAEQAFKAMYGCRIKEYQVKQRLNMAKKFLEEGMSKKILADKCYYGSLSAFSTAFKKKFGISPTAWENSFRNAPTAKT
ncbi:hypothetical protein A4H97_29840 [Niastella yeongjuensis]|uniref:HTH araC/xylS-type domain-containing protein n=1 Tax=Niastella yeongjuensis TaxID=354355 RepID=A0A1V9EPN1_9BACT|nr:helix-turn-helix domain-containing protein [Niastella yeongjuensis]OQP48041.1 hypothetical protein A4H97_29840 [Niastella yeongjuensis]SEO24502.1 AraC-type DNA-binding protein [Niastella yeongjuensis]